jgi:hypothetical protein
MRREQWLPPHFDAGTFRSFTAFRGPRLDQLSFEFSKTAQHCKHQPSGWRCGIRVGTPQLATPYVSGLPLSNTYRKINGLAGNNKL